MVKGKLLDASLNHWATKLVPSIPYSITIVTFSISCLGRIISSQGATTLPCQWWTWFCPKVYSGPTICAGNLWVWCLPMTWKDSFLCWQIYSQYERYRTFTDACWMVPGIVDHQCRIAGNVIQWKTWPRANAHPFGNTTEWKAHDTCWIVTENSREYCKRIRKFVVG